MNTPDQNLIDAFLKTPRLYGVRVSPDLQHVCWVWANVGPNADVYIAPISPTVSIDSTSESADNIAPTSQSAQPLSLRKLTNFGQDTSVVSWTQDSKSIVVKHDYDGDERYRLYRIDIATAEVTPLTDEHPDCFIRGGQITPDNKFLVYGANYDFETKQEIEPTIIYKHNLETGEKIKLAKPEKPSFLRPALNPAGTHILYTKNDLDPQGEQIWLVDINGIEDKEILNFGPTVKVSASWHNNSVDIIFVSEAKTYRKVGIFHTIDSTITWLIDNPSRNIEDAYMPRGTEYIVINEIVQAQNKITILDPETLEETICANINTITPIAKLADGNWLSAYYNSQQPTDIIVHDQSTVLRSITNIFEKVEYKSEDLVRAENYTWTSVDGLKIQGWLYKPTRKAIGTIVLVHGGPTGHSEDSWDTDIQYFVAEGFNVLDPNYRGSTGFGLTFQESIKEQGWGGREQDDILEGIKSLIKDGIATEGAVGVSGTSYGGYSAWFLITHAPRKYVTAAIPICGMTDLVVDYETTRPDLRGYSEEMMGGTPEQVPEKYKNASPIHFVKNITGDLLIVQGAKDPNVSLENVHAVETALKIENIPYEKLVFEDEGHGISKPENQKTLLLRSVEFFKQAFQK